MTGEGHLHQGDEQAAVGSVVVGDEFAIAHQRLDGVEEALELDRVVQIRRLVTQLAIDLGQGRGAEALLAVAKVDEDKVGLTEIGTQLRGDGIAHVLDPGKGGDEQESGEVTLCSLPSCCQRVFMDMESLPTGMVMPGPGRASPTALTAS